MIGVELTKATDRASTPNRGSNYIGLPGGFRENEFGRRVLDNLVEGLSESEFSGTQLYQMYWDLYKRFISDKDVMVDFSKSSDRKFMVSLLRQFFPDLQSDREQIFRRMALFDMEIQLVSLLGYIGKRWLSGQKSYDLNVVGIGGGLYMQENYVDQLGLDSPEVLYVDGRKYVFSGGTVNEARDMGRLINRMLTEAVRMFPYFSEELSRIGAVILANTNGCAYAARPWRNCPSYLIFDLKIPRELDTIVHELDHLRFQRLLMNRFGEGALFLDGLLAEVSAITCQLSIAPNGERMYTEMDLNRYRRWAEGDCDGPWDKPREIAGVRHAFGLDDMPAEKWEEFISFLS